MQRSQNIYSACRAALHRAWQCQTSASPDDGAAAGGPFSLDLVPYGGSGLWIAPRLPLLKTEPKTAECAVQTVQESPVVIALSPDEQNRVSTVHETEHSPMSPPPPRARRVSFLSPTEATTQNTGASPKELSSNDKKNLTLLLVDEDDDTSPASYGVVDDDDSDHDGAPQDRAGVPNYVKEYLVQRSGDATVQQYLNEIRTQSASQSLTDAANHDVSKEEHALGLWFQHTSRFDDTSDEHAFGVIRVQPFAEVEL